MESNPDLLKLLEQMEKAGRQQVRYARAQCFFSVLAAVCCLLVLISVNGALPHIQTLADQLQTIGSQAETVLRNLETVSSDLAQADLEGMVSNMDTLVTSSQTGVEQALEKINAIDIEKLNQAIASLNDVVEPLAKLVKAFK